MENRARKLCRLQYLDKQVFCQQSGGTPTFYLNSELCWSHFQPELQKAWGLSLAPLWCCNSLGTLLWLDFESGWMLFKGKMAGT